MFVWSKPAVLLNKYYKQEHVSNGWDDSSIVGCYAQRLSSDYNSEFKLKNGITYTAEAGYKLYDYTQGYDIDSDTLMQKGWDRKSPRFESDGGKFEVTWYNIEAASYIAVGIGAVWAMFF